MRKLHANIFVSLLNQETMFHEIHTPHVIMSLVRTVGFYLIMNMARMCTLVTELKKCCDLVMNFASCVPTVKF